MVEGRPLLLHAADAAAPFVEHITVVADAAGKYRDLGLSTIADELPQRGPLGGVYTALRAVSSDEPVLVLSCDLYGIQSAWIAALLREAERGNHLVTLYESEPLQPLFACYSSRLLPLVSSRLQEGKASMYGLIEAAGHAALPAPPDWARLRNINRPQDLPSSP